MATKVSKKENAGEVKTATPPINEVKVLGLIHAMIPESRAKADTLQNGVTFVLGEYNRVKIALSEALKNAPTAGSGGSNAEVLAGIKRLEDSLNNVKMQFSTMRQYGMGTK